MVVAGANLGHFRRHGRFYGAAAIGAAVWLLTWILKLPLHLTIAGDTFFVLYLLSMAFLTRTATPAALRRRAAQDDEGIVLIVLITLGAIGLSLGSIFLLINAPEKPDTLRLALAVLSVPLGWITLHTVMAFHYAHIFYSRHVAKKSADNGGLAFPDCSEPHGWDFLYFSFVIGMTAQVSDVQVQTTALRRLSLGHSVVSFFYNTVILAVAVNIVVSLGQ